MPGPSTPAVASTVLPPISGTAIVDERGILTVAGLNLFQQIWAGVFGSGGIVDQLPIPGEIVAFGGTTPPTGWLHCDGATYSTTAQPSLYAAIGTTWGSAGAGTFKVPDLRGKFPIGADGSHALGTSGGALSRTIAKANLPSYALSVTDPGHTHVVTDPGHTHVVTDPGHVHAITDPGHHHAGGSSPTTTNTAGAAGGTSAAADTGASGTGITVNSAVTGVTNNSAATGITNQNAATGVSVDSGGSGTALDTTPAFAAVNWLIKA